MRIFHLIMLLLLAVCTCVATPANTDVFTVVIDPGHGGNDGGCKGRTAKEKNIVLDVAKLLRDKIKDQYGKKVKVVMTRETDKFVALQSRADIANKANGDLFISIHINSLPAKTKGRERVQGVSVYTCGLDKSKDNLSVAMRENSVIELERDHSTRYQGFNPKSSESYIIFELSQHAHLQQSLKFAKLANDRLVSDAKRVNRGVRQAGFWVLWATAMPSVLVELDYICNPEQEKYLNSAKGKEACANALFKAFKTYYQQTKK